LTRTNFREGKGKKKKKKRRKGGKEIGRGNPGTFGAPARLGYHLATSFTYHPNLKKGGKERGGREREKRKGVNQRLVSEMRGEFFVNSLHQKKKGKRKGGGGRCPIDCSILFGLRGEEKGEVEVVTDLCTVWYTLRERKKKGGKKKKIGGERKDMRLLMRSDRLINFL